MTMAYALGFPAIHAVCMTDFSIMALCLLRPSYSAITSEFLRILRRETLKNRGTRVDNIRCASDYVVIDVCIHDVVAARFATSGLPVY